MDILLGVFDMQEAKRIQATLKNDEIDIEIRFNDQTCTSGCKISVEVWGNSKDEDHLINFLRNEMQRDLAGHKIDPKQMSEVFDPNKDSVTCQACGGEFKPTENVCPHCGLHY